VSSHPDDVALSIGGSILAGFFRRPLLLVTAFSYGGWAPYFPGKHEVGIISQQRTNEDETFAKAIGAPLVQLGLQDAAAECMFGRGFNLQRWFASIAHGGVIRGEEETTWLEDGLGRFAHYKVPRGLRWSLMERMGKLDRVYGSLTDILTQIASKLPGATLACPLGLGLHPDHVLVTTACKSLAKFMPVCYYEDLPYARDYPLASIQRHATRLDPDLRPVRVDVERLLAIKLDNLHLYSSQLGPNDFDKVITHAKRLAINGRACERIWCRN